MYLHSQAPPSYSTGRSLVIRLMGIPDDFNFVVSVYVFYWCDGFYLIVGINATSDVLISVDSSTAALTSSFVMLQNSLTSVRNDVTSLITQCDLAAGPAPGLQPTCDMIPRANQLQTEANFNDVSVFLKVLLTQCIQTLLYFINM